VADCANAGAVTSMLAVIRAARYLTFIGNSIFEWLG
jgi:hypothetical protein